MKLTKGMAELTTVEEQQEIEMVKPTVKLKRTFNQNCLDGSTIKFWRVMAPSTHKNYQSDLSIDGLRQWGII